jgi:hypothetical protein
MPFIEVDNDSSSFISVDQIVIYFDLQVPVELPGFDYKDYESGQRDVLLKSFPKFRDLIVALTKDNMK